MLEKIKSYQHHPYFHQLRDVRVIGLIIFGIISLLVTWNTLGAIQTNFELQKQIARLDEQNKVHELENTNLKLKNEYLNTDHYLELTARKHFGKGAPGEKVLLVPKQVALSKTVDIKPEDEDRTDPANRPAKPIYQRNFETWMDFFFQRQRL